MNYKAPSFAVCAVLSSWALNCAAQAPKAASAPVVPEAIKAPSTEAISSFANAKGFQVYESRAKKDDPSKFEWALKGPEADLFDEQGKKIGRHYAGPTWESVDGSKVVAELKGKVDAKEAGAVPWLLLSAKTHEGSGVFSAVTYIQRINTTGGKAPAKCEEKSAGKEFKSPYTAVYYFYAPKR